MSLVSNTSDNKSNMSCPQISAEVHMNESCFEYVLFVPAKWRMNANVYLPFGDIIKEMEENDGLQLLLPPEELIKFDMNPLPYIKEFLPEKYNTIIDIYKNQTPSEWFWIGCSDTGIASWFQYPSAAWSIEHYLTSSMQPAKLVKIVFTAELEEQDPPLCMPYISFNGEYMKLKYKPCISIEGGHSAFSNVIAEIECDERWQAFKPKAKKCRRKKRSSRKSEEELLA